MDLKNLTPQNRAFLKSDEIVNVVEKKEHGRPKYKIQIIDINKIDGGVEVFVRAFKDGKQIGFGKDGSVDIERFRIFNPPILVDDLNGDVVREWADEETGKVKQRKLRQDPEEALLQVIEHNLSVMKNIHDDSKIVKGKLGNTTTTIFPDAGNGNTTHDRSMQYENASWDTAHDASSAEALFTDSGEQYIRTQLTGAPKYNLVRYEVTFDTSVIPSDDTISSATLSIYVVGKSNDDDDAQAYMSVVQLQSVSAGSASINDWDQIGDTIDNPTEGVDTADRLDIGDDITTSQYNDFTFNATGIGWVSKDGEQKPSGNTAGITFLGIREGHDIEDDPITVTGSNIITISSADETGTTQDPKLVIEHTVGSTYSILLENSAFTLTGITTSLLLGLQLSLTVGSFTLSGVNILFKKGFSFLASTGSFILTGVDTTLNFFGWNNQTKNSSSFTNTSKSSTSWTNKSKS